MFLADLDENRLLVAKEMGATYTLKVTTRDSRALAKQVVDTLGCSPDRTIECSGAEPSIATAIYVSQTIVSLMLCKGLLITALLPPPPPPLRPLVQAESLYLLVSEKPRSPCPSWMHLSERSTFVVYFATPTGER